MSENSAKIYAAKLNQNAYTIDLHQAQNVSEALELLEHELYNCVEQNVKHARVIYGIGEGILREAVHDVFQEHPLILGWEQDDFNDGSAVIVF